MSAASPLKLTRNDTTLVFNKTQSLDRRACLASKRQSSYFKLSLPLVMGHHRRALSNPDDPSNKTIFENRCISPFNYFKRIAFVVKVLVMLNIKIKNQRNKGYWSRLETQTAIQQQLSEVMDWKLTDLPIIAPRTISGTHLQEILSLPIRKRTPIDELNLLRYVQRLHSIQDFPLNAQKHLAKVMSFESYDGGRIVIKEGHPAMAVYFIWYGSVYVNQKEKDVRNDRVFDVTVNVLKSGDWFGERGVLYRVKHNMTVVTRSYVELLVIDERDFHKVLAHSVLDKTNEAIQYISDLPMLSQWSIEELIETPDFIYAKYYRYNSVVIKYSPNYYAEWIVAVRKGSCKVIIEYNEHLQKRRREGFLPLIPPSISLVVANNNKTNQSSVIKRYMQLITIEQGECFGLQLIYNRASCKISVISRGSECILVNRQFFLKQTNSDLLRLYKTESGVYPERSKLLSAINEQNKWKLFKKQIIHECINNDH